jgi:hypothetical protein
VVLILQLKTVPESIAPLPALGRYGYLGELVDRGYLGSCYIQQSPADPSYTNMFQTDHSNTGNYYQIPYTQYIVDHFDAFLLPQYCEQLGRLPYRTANKQQSDRQLNWQFEDTTFFQSFE